LSCIISVSVSVSVGRTRGLAHYLKKSPATQKTSQQEHTIVAKKRITTHQLSQFMFNNLCKLTHAVGVGETSKDSLAYCIPSCHLLCTHPMATLVPVRPANTETELTKLGNEGKSSCRFSMSQSLPLQLRKGAIINSGWRSICSSHLLALRNHLALHKPVFLIRAAAAFHLLRFQTIKSSPTQGRTFWTITKKMFGFGSGLWLRISVVPICSI
jgi:hypothetical protein